MIRQLIIKILFRKEVDNIALIIKGKRTYTSVPAILKEQVKEILTDLELGNFITE